MLKRTSASSLLQLAAALADAGHYAAALPLYRRALALRPTGTTLHAVLLGLGSSLRCTGNPKSAIRTLRRARTLFPRDVAVILFLALAHADAGQHTLALRQLADALLKESRQPQLTPFRRTLSRQYHACR